MPIKIPLALPARETLESEYIFVMDELRALHQDIRPLKIAILNLMPTKITTETQLIRLLSNTPLQIDLTLLHTETYRGKNTSVEHMEAFYKSYSDVKKMKFDGLIITGAPVENLDYTEVSYWDELCEIMNWTKTNVYSTFYICWAAQAGLYYHYGVEKHSLPKKIFGVFEHRVLNFKHPLLRGFDEIFMAPHSRHTEIRSEDLLATGQIDILSDSPHAGVYIAASKDCRQFFVTGHSEYDYDTLSHEYFRDLNRGLDIEMPYNYFPDNDPTKKPINIWRGHANLLFSNWLNYFVYQRTPYDIEKIGEKNNDCPFFG
ncbi:MAG: homoserine O-succinyltransferase [Clostridiales bacterium]|nr:homoserine O-succinyltransferase [Clostridiales bacterium]